MKQQATGCLFACTPDADSSMRKGLCAETPSVSHNDRDWLDVYRAAAMEFDRDKLPASIDVAEKAIHQRLRRLPLAHSKEHGKLETHSTVSRFSRECSSPFGVLKHLLLATCFAVAEHSMRQLDTGS